MRHSTFNMRTICLLAALSGITVLSAQTPGKPRVQTSAAPEETTVYKPGGKSRKQQLRLLQKRRRINANPAKRIQERKRLPLMVNAIWH